MSWGIWPWRLAVILSIPILLLAALGLAMRQPTFGRRASLPPAGADPARLQAHVRRLCEDLLPRDGGHPENLRRAAAYLSAEFQAAGAAVEAQAFEFEELDRRNRRVRRGPFRNLIVSFGPETPERLVVGAHYDAYGPFPGADDNASGAAALLELARLLSATPPPLRTEVVAYALEEPPYFGTPHMGSVEHASALARRGGRVRAMWSLEMIGRFSDAPGSQAFPMPLLKLYYPSRGDFIAVVGHFGQAALLRRTKAAMRRASDLPVYSIAAPGFLPGIDNSDHASYLERGFPGVMITDTAFYRNSDYHGPGDVASALDYKRMAKVVDGVFAAVQSFR